MAFMPSSVCPSLHLPDNGKSESGASRRLASFHPTIWGDHFINNFSHDPTKIDTWTKSVEQLTKEVKEMLTNTKDSLQKMKFIDTLQRLGVARHFNNEIKESLQTLYDEYEDVARDDLYFTALRFRLLRQQGYNVSSDVFKKFQDGEGNWKENLTSGVEGLLSLYEASHLSVAGETILDIALKFTRMHLRTMMANLSFPLSKKVEFALELPVHKCEQRIDARRYISLYQEDKARNNIILELAKLDFNLLQKLHQRELRDISMWRKDMDLPSKLPFARDRLVECYYWMLGVYFEEKYSRARMILTKILDLLTFMDDIYDMYGTIDELQLLTDAIQRWDVAAAEGLPEYAKVFFLALLNSCDQIVKQLSPEELYRMTYLEEMLKEFAIASLVECKWYSEGYVPTFEEYLRNGLITSGTPLLCIVSLVGMGEIANKEAFDWFKSKPKLIMAAAKVGRLVDDVKSHERETMTGNVATSIDCYVKEHGVSEEKAIETLYEMIMIAWKDINKECLKPMPFDMPLLMRPLNLVRMTEIIYLYEDGYTDSTGKTKENIKSLLVDSIPV